MAANYYTEVLAAFTFLRLSNFIEIVTGIETIFYKFLSSRSKSVLPWSAVIFFALYVREKLNLRTINIYFGCHTKEIWKQVLFFLNIARPFLHFDAENTVSARLHMYVFLFASNSISRLLVGVMSKCSMENASLILEYLEEGCLRFLIGVMSR